MANCLLSKFHYLAVLSVFHLHIQQISANKCDEDIFYRPYVLVKKKKNGGDLASLRSSGFLDLRFRNRVLLCMNGPVVLYSDVERLDPESRLQAENDKSKDTLQSAPEARYPSPDHGLSNDGAGEEELRFRKGELLVFNHQCISVNKIPTNFLKKMKEDQGRSNPEIMPDTQVMGRLVLGVFLIGDKESYQKPELAWFKGTNYDYIKTKDKTVKDSSFIISNAKSSHCLRLPDGTHVKIGGGSHESNGSIEVCKWTVKEEDKHWYAKVFQRGYDSNGIRNGEETLEEGDYEFYECPDGDPDRNIILTMSKTTPEPISHANYTEFDPFSLFNPNIWTPHGYRRDSNGLSGGDERTEDKAMNAGVAPDGDVPCSMDPSNPGCMENDDMEETTLKDMQNVDPITSTAYEIVAGECLPLPMFDMASCDGIGDNGNRILELVLELLPVVGPCDNMTVAGSGPSAPPPPSGGTGKRRKRTGGGSGTGTGGPNPAVPEQLLTNEDKEKLPDCGNLDTNIHLKWKMDILYLVSEIFSYLCMPFRADFPYTVARVFAWYVMRAHAYGENMGRVDPGTDVPVKGTSDQFDHLIKQTDTWIILGKELERCAAMAKNENGGKGIKFQWEVGEESGKWKIPAVDGRPTRRRKRSVDQTEYPTYGKRSSAANRFFAEEKKRLSRKKRATNHSAPVLSNKYILPGKTMTVIKSEGTVGYAREVIQEYRPKPDLNDPRADSSKYCDYPENIQHCWHPQEDPVNKQIVCSKTEDIFFYEDRAEIEYELNIAIDLWWKIWATAIGYCNKAYHSRKSETFPRLYNSKYEYFFELVLKEWKQPQDNEDLKVIFSEYLTEENHIWLDACVEASYINSNSHSYRPPRPMSIEENAKEVSNYFEEVPTYLYYRYHPEPSIAM